MDVDLLLETLAYTGLGAIVFAVAFLVMVRLVPFSVKKEIEDDQNTALAIIMGSVILGLAMIISAAVSG